MIRALRRNTRSLYARLSHWGLDLIGQEPVGPVRRGLLRCLGRRALTPGSFAMAATQSHDLQAASISSRSPPCLVGTTPDITRDPSAQLRAHVIQDAIASPYAAGVICQDRLLLPDEVLKSRQRCRTDGGDLFRFERGHCFGRTPNPERIPAGLMIGGAGAFNWYHFLIECLPKAFLADMLPAEQAAWPLLVPDECRRFPSFAQALAVFAGQRQIRYLSRREFLHVERLVVFDEVSVGPFNLYAGTWPESADYGQHDDLLRAYLQRLRATLLDAAPPALTRRRIFLVRPGARRNYNQDELVAIARRYGFEPHAPETLSLPDQARLFAEAEMVVGASGAAWVGMAFCPAPTRMLSWLPPEYREFCSYSNLATVLGHRMEFLDLIPDQPLKSSDDAYLQGYRVAPGPFEHAMQLMTGAHALTRQSAPEMTVRPA